jgi:hypothetical protein
VHSGNIGVLLPPISQWFDAVSSYSLFFSVFIVEHYFRTQSDEAVKQAYYVYFPGPALPNKPNAVPLHVR